MGILGKGLTCSAFFILTAFSLSAEAKTCGTFNHVEGDVKYLSKSGETQWQEASLGESICPGGSIASASTGRATIEFPAGEELHISPNTRLVVTAMESEINSKKKKALLNLINGKVRANIPPDSYKSSDTQFRIRSETAVAGVRGTQFVMSYSTQTKTSEVVTLRGQVEVGQPVGRGFNFTRSVMVRTGQRTVATPQMPPTPPRDLPTDEVRSIDDSTAAAPATETEPAEVADNSAPSSEPSTPSESNEVAPSPESSEAREPASIAPAPSMVAPDDMTPPPTSALTGPPDLLLKEPLRDNLPPPTQCDFCDDRIADGPARLKVRILPGN